MNKHKEKNELNKNQKIYINDINEIKKRYEKEIKERKNQYMKEKYDINNKYRIINKKEYIIINIKKIN